MEGKQVPALLRSNFAISDNVSINKFTAFQYGYMSKFEYDNLSHSAAKVFANESSAKSSNPGDKIIKVKVEYLLDDNQ